MNAKILSGQEEALGGWITANYVNGTFMKTYVREGGKDEYI